MTILRTFWLLASVASLFATSARASDYFREIRQSQTSDDELVLLKLDPEKILHIRNWNDASDPLTENGHCFGIVHLEQYFSAKGDSLFEEGPRDSAEQIEEKLFKTAQGKSSEKISGFSSLAEFLKSPESQEAIKNAIHRIQAAHKILQESGQTKAHVGSQTAGGVAPGSELPVSVSSSTSDSVKKEIENRIRSGKTLHLSVRPDEGPWGHSVQVVGFLKSRSTGEMKIIVKDSNTPDRLRVMTEKNGAWSYDLTSTQGEQKVNLAVVDDGLFDAPPSHSLLSELPSSEADALASTNRKNPLQFACPQEDGAITQFMSGVSRFASP